MFLISACSLSTTVGIDVNIKDNRGLTALDIVRELPSQKSQHIAALIEGKQCSSARGQEGRVWGANCACASKELGSLVLESAESNGASGWVPWWESWGCWKKWCSDAQVNGPQSRGLQEDFQGWILGGISSFVERVQHHFYNLNGLNCALFNSLYKWIKIKDSLNLLAECKVIALDMVLD